MILCICVFMVSCPRVLVALACPSRDRCHPSQVNFPHLIYLMVVGFLYFQAVRPPRRPVSAARPSVRPPAHPQLSKDHERGVRVMDSCMDRG